MKTVEDNYLEIIIKKSKFLVYTFNINSTEEIDKKIEEIKHKYNDATHICYAYILNNIAKCNDDGEPSGTAGYPILNVLQKEKLTNVLTIIVRYFGGIKLGAAGLIRAYANACKDSLKIISLKKGYKIKLKFDYEFIKKVDYLLKNCTIENKIYNEKTVYTVLIDEDNLKNLKNNSFEFEILDNIYIKN